MSHSIINGISLVSSILGLFLFFLLRDLHRRGKKFWLLNMSILTTELPQILSTLILKQDLSGQIQHPKMPNFRFYVPLIEMLLEHRQKFGLTIKVPLQQLRSVVLKEISAENKLRFIFRQSLGQFLLAQILSFFLIFLFSLSGFHLTFGRILFILVVSLLGPTLFFYQLEKQQVLSSGPYKLILPIFYKCFIQSQLERPLKIDSGQLNLGKSEHLIRWWEAFLDIVSKRQKWGVSIRDELEVLAQELWFHWDMDLEIYKGKIERFKFLFLTIFMMINFLSVVYGLIQDLLKDL